MEYCFLGKTGIQVSSLCMGPMTFGREADMAASKDIFHRCRDAGMPGSIFLTAPMSTVWAAPKAF